jgi:multisubunit Na+/H+ antiporter MnhE subunit
VKPSIVVLTVGSAALWCLGYASLDSGLVSFPVGVIAALVSGDVFRRGNHLPPTGFVALDPLLHHG